MSSPDGARWGYRRGRVFGELVLDDRALLRDDWDTGPSQDYVESVWRWACAVLNGESIADRPPLRGHWRYANGYVFAGTMRIAALADFRDESDLSPQELLEIETAVEKLASAAKASLAADRPD